jgi:hypothetical protein
MGWLGKTDPPPAMTTTLANFAFSDGDIFEMGHISSHNQHFASSFIIMFKINL